MKGVPFRPWTGREDLRLLEWREQGISDEEIGRRLNRSISGVQMRRRRLGEITLRRWAKAEDDKLRELCSQGATHRTIADALQRTKMSIKNRVNKLKLNNGHYFTDQEKELVRCNFTTTKAKDLAARIGKTTGQIYRLAKRLGLSKCRHWTKAERRELAAFIRQKHPLQWVDREIAEAWNAAQPDLHVSREWVTEVRRLKCRMPHNALSDRRRRMVAKKTKDQLKKVGLKSLAAVRVQAFRDFAARQGWPGIERPRLVQILNLLYEKGPQTRQQICAALGLSWNPCKHKPRGLGLRGNGPGGTYTAELKRMGLVVSLGRKVKTGPQKGAHCELYAIAPGVVRGPISPRSAAS